MASRYPGINIERGYSSGQGVSKITMNEEIIHEQKLAFRESTYRVQHEGSEVGVIYRIEQFKMSQPQTNRATWGFAPELHKPRSRVICVVVHRNQMPLNQASIQFPLDVSCL